MNFQERGVLPAVDLAGDNDSAWKLPGMSVVKDYISDAHARKRTFRTSTVLRSFPYASSCFAVPLLSRLIALRRLHLTGLGSRSHQQSNNMLKLRSSEHG